MSATKKASFILLALLFWAVIKLHLGSSLLLGLASFMILDLTSIRLQKRLPKIFSKFISLLIFLIIAGTVGWVSVHFVQLTIATVPSIVNVAIPRVIGLAETYNVTLPFDNALELREIAISTLKENVQVITKTSGFLSKKVFHWIAAMVIAIFCFFSESPIGRKNNLFDTLSREMRDRIQTFMQGFEKVLGAQLIISSINTALTAIFLIWMGLPHIAFLIPATFAVGILPLIGNIISNTFIVGTALTISLYDAALALGFLVVLHKAEYLLNSRIMGGSVRFPTWLTLTGIIVGELVMGVPGIILAPALLHYVREEMRLIATSESL